MSDEDGTAFADLARRLAIRVIELANAPDDGECAAGIREVFAPHYVLHSRMGGTVVGVDAYIERIMSGRVGLPNKTFVIDDIVIDADRFALRYHWSALHGSGSIGNEALEINRVADGQIVETWNYQDMLSLMIQLGVVADPFAQAG